VTASPPPGPWRIATRRSALARTQAQTVADALAAATGRPAELVPLATTGDEHPDRAIEAFDAKGLFVDGTRQAVLDGAATSSCTPTRTCRPSRTPA
jgi:hydroxymethylbilane synthase